MIRYARAARDARAYAMGACLAGGYLCIYSGLQPRSVDYSVENVALAELRFGIVESGPEVGVVTFELTPDFNAHGGGRASWFRALDANRVPVLDGDAGLVADSPSLVLDDVNIRPGAVVRAAGFRYVAGASDGRS